MVATTIKLDSKLHSAIRRMKPRDQTLTGFAVVPAIRQIAKTRLLDVLATLSAADLQKLERAVAQYLSD